MMYKIRTRSTYRKSVMIKKILIIVGATIGGVIGFLRTENVIQDVSGFVWGIILGSLVAYFVWNFIESLME